MRGHLISSGIALHAAIESLADVAAGFICPLEQCPPHAVCGDRNAEGSRYFLPGSLRRGECGFDPAGEIAERIGGFGDACPGCNSKRTLAEQGMPLEESGLGCRR